MYIDMHISVFTYVQAYIFPYVNIALNHIQTCIFHTHTLMYVYLNIHKNCAHCKYSLAFAVDINWKIICHMPNIISYCTIKPRKYSQHYL